MYKLSILTVVGAMLTFMFAMLFSGKLGQTFYQLPQGQRVLRVYARTLLLATFLILVPLIEIGVRLKGGAHHDTVYFVHSTFAALYTASVILLFLCSRGTIRYRPWIPSSTVISFVLLALVAVPMTIARF